MGSGDHESAIVRHVCCACYTMGLGSIWLDQVNRTFILGEYNQSRCLQCYTDLDKNGASRPGYIPVVDFHGRSWVDDFLISTVDVLITGFLLKEDDSTYVDPFLVSKFKQIPKRGRCVTKCVREILVMVYDVPRTQIKKIGISSFRKFYPQLPNSSNSRTFAVQTSVCDLVVSLKRKKDRLVVVFANRQGLLPDKCAPEVLLCKSVRLYVFLSENLVKKTRETILAGGGINHLPITGSWDTLFPVTTVSSLSSDGINSVNSSSNSYAE